MSPWPEFRVKLVLKVFSRVYYCVMNNSRVRQMMMISHFAGCFESWQPAVFLVQYCIPAMMFFFLFVILSHHLPECELLVVFKDVFNVSLTKQIVPNVRRDY